MGVAFLHPSRASGGGLPPGIGRVHCVGASRHIITALDLGGGQFGAIHVDAHSEPGARIRRHPLGEFDRHAWRTKMTARNDSRMGGGNNGDLSSRAAPDRQRSPLNAAGLAQYGGVLAGEITISGKVESGPTTRNITYFVLDRSRDAVVGNITLPDAATFANAFRLNVSVPDAWGSLDVGLFDDTGKFASAGFQVEVPKQPTGAVGPRQ